MHCGGCPRVPGVEFVQLIYPHGGTFKGTGLPFAYGGEPVSEKGPWVLSSPLEARYSAVIVSKTVLRTVPSSLNRQVIRPRGREPSRSQAIAVIASPSIRKPSQVQVAV